MKLARVDTSELRHGPGLALIYLSQLFERVERSLYLWMGMAFGGIPVLLIGPLVLPGMDNPVAHSAVVGVAVGMIFIGAGMAGSIIGQRNILKLWQYSIVHRDDTTPDRAERRWCPQRTQTESDRLGGC